MTSTSVRLATALRNSSKPDAMWLHTRLSVAQLWPVTLLETIHRLSYARNGAKDWCSTFDHVSPEIHRLILKQASLLLGIIAVEDLRLLLAVSYGHLLVARVTNKDDNDDDDGDNHAWLFSYISQ